MSAKRSSVAWCTVPAVALLAGTLITCGAPPQARAQDSTATSPRVISTFRRTGEEVDRFELGGGVVQGFFDVVGSFGYRRSIGLGQQFERSIMAELTGTAKNQLTEGVFSAYFLFRPLVTFREHWRLRPLVEFGPGVHTVFQVASLEGLSRTRYRSQVYLKAHGYAGFEVLASNHLGFLVRGRLSAPSHRPLDYAQAAIFLR